MEEVRQAALPLPSGGAPGPNGFGGSFFKGCWQIVCADILEATTFLFKGGDLPRAFTSTLMCLILKSVAPSAFHHFRPISLCNYIYKIFSKVIASRLAAVLPGLISSEQGWRATLIKYVLGSILIHTMAATPMLARCLSNMEKSFANFFWGWKNGKKKLHWTNCKIVAPITVGGLGIRRLRDMMKALRLKMAWAISHGNSSSIWATYMRVRYGVPTATGHYHSRSRHNQSAYSPLWNNILALFPLLAANI
ncbi:uncharacterized protein LOC131231775 [Magnolia sinica]|uniref:uncharacterized protein LOC131231775 n=1 Tax=Magnolia sinica TaxID=86752 RepID=UPI002657E4B1|nr:uncharacterized protein LOC131231775 [Magnolia sinica]